MSNSVHPNNLYVFCNQENFENNFCRIDFFFNNTATTEIYTLSLHDALPISRTTGGTPRMVWLPDRYSASPLAAVRVRSEEHTSELQSRRDLVCRLLLEKKKKTLEYRAIGLCLPLYLQTT